MDNTVFTAQVIYEPSLPYNFTLQIVRSTAHSTQRKQSLEIKVFFKIDRHFCQNKPSFFCNYLNCQ